MPKKSKRLSELMLGKATKLADGITTEELSAVYFDNSKIKYQSEPLYRLDSSGHRYYYRIVNNEPVFYTSVTTLIKNTLPTPPSLIKWIADKGQEEGAKEAMERADYGTLMHECCAELLINGKFDLDNLTKKLALFTAKNNIPVKEEWTESLKKDILAFAQFVIDFSVTPLAVEIVLYHPTDGYAGAIDLCAEVTYKKERIRAIIDLKSGKKGFYESHEIQLQAYKNMWNIHFPDYPIDRVFNFSPKDYRTNKPTYNFKDQTDSVNANKLPSLVQLAKIEDAKRENKITIISGKIDLAKGIENNIKELTFTELVKPKDNENRTI